MSQMFLALVTCRRARRPRLPARPSDGRLVLFSPWQWGVGCLQTSCTPPHGKLQGKVFLPELSPMYADATSALGPEGPCPLHRCLPEPTPLVEQPLLR